MPDSNADKELIDYEIKYADQRTEYFSLNKSFLNNLEKNQIEYHGVDVPRSSADYRDYLSKSGFNLRDGRMSKADLREERAVFGFRGAFHAHGMQQKILEQLSQEEASNSFLFIHIYKEPPDSEQEAALRNGEINHPLSLHIYNANEMNEDQIAASILEQINSKYMINQQKEHKNNYYPFYTNDELYGFFNKVEQPSWEKIHSPKNQLKNYIEKFFGENGRYKMSLLSALDPNGDKYCQEITDFIKKPQHFDTGQDHLNIADAILR